MAEDEINTFIGSILNIKTKPSPEGIGSCIIGTLCAVDQANGTIALDEVVRNGEMMPNGFILSTADIGDLQICGRSTVTPSNLAESVISPGRSSKEVPNEKKPLKENVPVKRPVPIASMPKTQTSKPPQQSHTKVASNLADPKNQQNPPNSAFSGLNTSSSVLTPSKPNTNASPNGLVSANGHALMDMFSQCMKIQPQATTTGDKNNGIGLEKNVNSTKRADDPKVVYKASAVEQNYFINARKPDTKAFQQVLQQNQAQGQGEKSKPILTATAKTPTIRKDQQGTTMSQSYPGPSNGNGTKRGNAAQQSQNGSSAQRQGGGAAAKLQQNATTFEMTTDEIREIKANEFDFQKNNDMFEKLPVHSKKATKPQHIPHLTNEDTTLKLARTVESIKLKGIPSPKTFVTSTGVIIPAVEQGTRNSILTLAHNLGITQSRTVESMGRSIAQVCIPLLGDSFRFSPEREDDRPKVLFCTGPLWQGAATICAARVLASQGVHTFVYAAMAEQTPTTVDVEQKLYKLTCQPFSQDIASFAHENFDLVVLGVGEQMKSELKFKKFRPFLENKPVVLVDPPLLATPYHKVLYGPDGDSASAVSSSSSRVYLITANLPLPYPTDNGLKIYLVNLGIPRRIYDENNVIYKSPFGDKLVIPIFSAPISLQPLAPTPT